ncbi:hypothetical protein D9M70_594820 [compost metagenome]
MPYKRKGWGNDLRGCGGVSPCTPDLGHPAQYVFAEHLRCSFGVERQRHEHRTKRRTFDVISTKCHIDLSDHRLLGDRQDKMYILN